MIFSEKHVDSMETPDNNDEQGSLSARNLAFG
jgi:hypothetical protein